jgi:hypothetical protein
MSTEKITTAKKADINIWINPENPDQLSLNPVAGFDKTTQAPGGWELVIFNEPGEMAAYMRALERHDRLGTRFAVGLSIVGTRNMPALLIEIEEWQDYLDLVETAEGHEGDLIVRLPG